MHPRQVALPAIALLISLLSCATAFAHHSFAMFDQSRQVTLKGAVREFQWTNPHAFIHIAVAGASGTETVWQIELNSPNNLKRQGWKPTSLKPGDEVTLILNPLKDGSNGGLFVAVTLPDGSILGDPTRAGGAQPINVPTTH